MLTLFGGGENRFCDGVSRRGFLRVGGLAFGGLTLADILRAEEQSGSRSQKSVIMIYLPGGPPHQDMFDLKMDAPSNIRGEFRPMPTNVSGIQICELFPSLARQMDRLVVLRSIVGSDGRHDSHLCLTGHKIPNAPRGGWPEYGSVVSAIQGSTNDSIPSYVNLFPKMKHRPYNVKGPGFLGAANSALLPQRETRQDLVLNGVTPERLGKRGKLLDVVDTFRRRYDDERSVAGLDAYQTRALDILTSSRLARALDLSDEDPRVVDRYGYGTSKDQGDASPRLMGHFLMARRLVEAGVRCVSVSFSFWDWHGRNFRHARENFPDLDQGLSALIEDLHQRGLDKDTTVIVWGEFGRTPHINKDGGRDHWPRVMCGLLAGGGMRTGQVIGSTTRDGGEARDRPVHFDEVFATLYHNLGIDANAVTIDDLNGRPHYLVESGAEPIAEVI